MKPNTMMENKDFSTKNGADPINVSKLRKPMEDTHTSRQNHSLQWRLNALKTIQTMLINHNDEFCKALELDLGRSYTATRLAEIVIIQNEISTFMKNLKQWMKPIPVPTPFCMMPILSEYRHEPLLSPGVFIIAPFNFPLLLCLLPVIGALGGGNPVLCKPSEHNKNFSELLERLVQSYFDKGVFQVVQGGPELSIALLKEPWGKVFFTGSERVGKIVNVSCAQTMTPVVLELGGKNPVYFDANVPNHKLRIMTKRIIWGRCENAGQICTSPNYLLCHEDVIDKVIDNLKSAVEEMFGKDVNEPDSELCKIVTKNQAQNLVDMIKEVQDSETTSIITGGIEKCNVEERLVFPTLIRNPPLDSKIMKEEIFGPILPILSVRNEKEAIDFINNQPGTPLCLYVFSTSLDLYNRMVVSCRSGTASHNEVLIHFLNNHLPFGGLGTSGIGHCRGKFSFEGFTHKLSSTTHPCVALPEAFNMRYPPLKGVKGRILLLFTKLPDIHDIFYTRKLWLGFLLVTSSLIFKDFISEHLFQKIVEYKLKATSYQDCLMEVNNPLVSINFDG